MQYLAGERLHIVENNFHWFDLILDHRWILHFFHTEAHVCISLKEDTRLRWYSWNLPLHRALNWSNCFGIQRLSRNVGVRTSRGVTMPIICSKLDGLETNQKMSEVYSEKYLFWKQLRTVKLMMESKVKFTTEDHMISHGKTQHLSWQKHYIPIICAAK